MAGGVVHFEIPADDEHRAREFYRSIFGWEFQVLPEMDGTRTSRTPRATFQDCGKTPRRAEAPAPRPL
ncbi:VOC family protein [Arthrobacter sp. ES1]|uniref:VOC family protein n=1 Tax=Arthrobacter sp. ES1 TaxID=1897056 RepID=UPI0037BEC203